jgi:hypothetical protein
VLRVDVVFLGVRPQPANGGLTILNLGRKFGLLAEAIFDAGDDVSPRHLVRETAAGLASALPSAAVNPDQQRLRAFAGRRR